MGGDFFGGLGFFGFAEVFEYNGADGLHFAHGVAWVIGVVAEAFRVVVGDGLVDVLEGGDPLLELHVSECAGVEAWGGSAELFVDGSYRITLSTLLGFKLFYIIIECSAVG